MLGNDGHAEDHQEHTWLLFLTFLLFFTYPYLFQDWLPAFI